MVKNNEPITSLQLNGTTIEFTRDERDSAGDYVMQNYRSLKWSSDTDIGWDRYGDYWILGEFEPAFDYRDDRQEPPGHGQYCLFHGFYSIYVTYVPKFGGGDPNFPGYEKEHTFMFGFYKNVTNATWYGAYTDTLVFDPGDTLRYAVRHRGTNPKGMKIWVRNVTDGVTVEAESDDYDESSGGFQPIRDIRIGSNTHGNGYDVDRPKDPWYGSIYETILGQGGLSNGAAKKWIEDGEVPGASNGDILYQQTQAARDVMIPLHEWILDSGTSACLRLRTKLYTYADATTDTHAYLQVTPCDYPSIPSYCHPDSGAYTGTCENPVDPETVRISYDADEEIDWGDLTRKDIAFAFRVPRWGSYNGAAWSDTNLAYSSLRISLEDDSQNTGELWFIPEGTYSVEGDHVEIPIPRDPPTGGKWNWRYAEFDMLDYFQDLYPSASTVTVTELAVTGYVQFADIILSGGFGESSASRMKSRPGASPTARAGVLNVVSPAFGSMKIRMAMGHLRMADLQIYDVSGRRIRSERLGGQSTIEWTWDGITDTGLKSRSGIYFIVLVSGQETHIKKAVLIR